MFEDGDEGQGDAPDTTESSTDTDTEEVDESAGDEGAEGTSTSKVGDTDKTSQDRDTAKYFLDPNKVPKELKPAWDRMQASFTRKMQAASQVSRQAAAFQELVADPDFRSWYEAKANGSAGRSQSNTEDEDEGDLDNRVNRLVESRVGDLERKFYQDQAAREFETFQAANPNWRTYQHEMEAFMQRNPNATYEEAYRNASYGDARKAGGEEVINDRLPGKKRANITKPSSVAPGKVTKKPSSIREAYEMAKEQLRK